MLSQQIYRFCHNYTRHVHQGAWILGFIFEVSLLGGGELLVPKFASSCASRRQSISLFLVGDLSWMSLDHSGTCPRPLGSLSLPTMFLSLWRSSCWTFNASRMSSSPVDKLISFLLQPEPSSWKSCNEALPLKCKERRDNVTEELINKKTLFRHLNF